jgi:hypothetical protein
VAQRQHREGEPLRVRAVGAGQVGNQRALRNPGQVAPGSERDAHPGADRAELTHGSQPRLPGAFPDRAADQLAEAGNLLGELAHLGALHHRCELRMRERGGKHLLVDAILLGLVDVPDVEQRVARLRH